MRMSQMLLSMFYWKRRIYFFFTWSMYTLHAMSAVVDLGNLLIPQVNNSLYHRTVGWTAEVTPLGGRVSILAQNLGPLCISSTSLTSSLPCNPHHDRDRLSSKSHLALLKAKSRQPNGWAMNSQYPEKFSSQRDGCCSEDLNNQRIMTQSIITMNEG